MALPRLVLSAIAAPGFACSSQPFAEYTQPSYLEFAW